MENYKIKIRERVFYAIGDFGGCFGTAFISTYLLIFYTNILGITPAAAGTLLFIMSIWDAINDPLLGTISDRTRTRFGRFRPYLLVFAIPTGIFFILLFTAPGLSYTGKLIWAYVIYFLFDIMSTFVTMSYGALPNLMTKDSNERIVLGAFRDWGANLGSFLLNGIAVPVILFFGSGEMNARGYFALAVIVGSVAAVSTLITFFGTKERVEPHEDIKINVISALKAISKNQPTICIILMIFFIALFLQFKGAFTTYFSIYYLGDEKSIGLILVVMFTLPLVGLPFVPKMIKILGRKKMFIISGAFAVLCGVTTLIARTNIVLIIISSIWGGLTLTGIFANIWGVLPDTADYGEWKTGVYTPGVTYAMAVFAFKLAVAFSSLISGWILSLARYDAALEVQEAFTISALYWCYGIIPIIFGILGIIAILPFNLTNELIEKIKAELAVRHAEAGSGTGEI